MFDNHMSKWIKGKGGYAKKILIDKISGRIKSIQINKFPSKAHIPPHYHKKTTELFYILQGNATMKVGKKVYKAKPGMIILNPAGSVHELKNGPKETRLLTFKINSREGDLYWIKKY